MEFQSAFRSDDDTVFFRVRSYDEQCGTATDVNSLPLADRIEMRSFVNPDDVAGEIEDIPRFFGQSFLEESFHAHFSDETQSLAVSSFGVRQSRLPGEFAHAFLFQFPDGEERVRQLLL